MTLRLIILAGALLAVSGCVVAPYGGDDGYYGDGSYGGYYDGSGYGGYYHGDGYGGYYHGSGYFDGDTYGDHSWRD